MKNHVEIFKINQLIYDRDNVEKNSSVHTQANRWLKIPIGRFKNQNHGSQTNILDNY